MSTKNSVSTTPQTSISSYSRLSVGKKRMTIVISVPCVDQSCVSLLDSFYEQTEKIASYIESHQLAALV